MEPLEYRDFEIEIGVSDGTRYPVAVLHSPSGQARTVTQLPFDRETLDQQLAALEDAILGDTHDDPAQVVHDFGSQLFDALIREQVRSVYDRSRQATVDRRVILLPSFEQSQVTDPVVFSDQIVFQVQVFDTRAGSYDGAGIQHVTFRIEVDDGSKQVVYERKEEHAGYCAFGGGEPDCNVLVLHEGGDNRWPDPFGGEIISGEYLARIDIVPQDGEPTQWRWQFNIEVPGQTGGEPQPPDNTARINSITIQDGRYIVDFETFGYEPLLPDQHVHFFLNNVPPDQAGVPGSGPWQIYPTGPGQLNTSLFTLYTVDQRPPDATQICILVANADHSVNQGTGNCVDLP